MAPRTVSRVSWRNRAGRGVAVGKVYCSRCFARISDGAAVCPVCGAEQQDLGVRDYRDKLLDALGHPLDDVRMRAIVALGMRHESGVAARLAECVLQHPLDVNAGLEVVRILNIRPRIPLPGPQARRGIVGRTL